MPRLVCAHAATFLSTNTHSPVSPQYKRLSAFQGDFVVGSARRTMLEAALRFKVPLFSVRVPVCLARLPLTCVAVWKRNKGIKYLGSVHGEELPEFYGISQENTDRVALDSVCELGWQSLRPQCCEVDRPPLQYHLPTFRTPSHPRINFLVRTRTTCLGPSVVQVTIDLQSSFSATCLERPTGSSKTRTGNPSWNSSLRSRLRSAHETVLFLFCDSETTLTIDDDSNVRLLLRDGSGNPPEGAYSVNLFEISFFGFVLEASRPFDAYDSLSNTRHCISGFCMTLSPDSECSFLTDSAAAGRKGEISSPSSPTKTI